MAAIRSCRMVLLLVAAAMGCRGTQNISIDLPAINGEVECLAPSRSSNWGSVPVRYDGQLHNILVTILVQSTPMSFVLDTGAEEFSLTRTGYEKLKRHSTQIEGQAVAANGVQVVPDQTIVIGRLTLRRLNLPIVAGRDADSDRMMGLSQFDGFAPLGFMKSVRLLLNLEAGYGVLGASGSPKTLSLDDPAVVSIPLSLQAEGVYIQVGLDGRTLDMYLDTGLAGLIEVPRNTCETVFQPGRFYPRVSPWGTDLIRRAVARRATIGQLVMNMPEILECNSKRARQPYLVGGDLLCSLSSISEIDVSSGEIRLKISMPRMRDYLLGVRGHEELSRIPDKPWGRRQPRRTSVTVKSSSIEEVATGGPAAVAGLRAQDRILTVNGRSIIGVPLEEYEAVWHKVISSSSVVRLRIARGVRCSVRAVNVLPVPAIEIRR